MSETPKTSPEHTKRLGLSGVLKAFEGTALAPLIESSLTDAGIDTHGYKLSKHDHVDYRGLPATTIDPYDQDRKTLSPIIEAIDRETVAGRIRVSRPAHGTVRFNPWTRYPKEGTEPFKEGAELTSQLSTLGMLELSDAETGDTLAYAALLNTDGGRYGHVLLSTNAVTTGHEAF